MEISINNLNQLVKESLTLQELVLEHVGENTKGIAVAVNDTVVPRTAWETTSLKSNDSILIIKATQGG